LARKERDNGLAIEIRRLRKSFRIPIRQPETLKEQIIHPLRGSELKTLDVLDDISFEVLRGEFFGIVGRNGSGKSTLLKLIASVYRADSGRIRVAGTIGPVIELGVGFQPELTARDNVILNGLMLGLTPREARRRFDAVIDFAELSEFVDMKLKNYSSGMRVRLAFAITMQTDPDVLLLDEVLAVGDEPFQRRCQVAFEEFKRRGTKTIVLVTHAMTNLERYCDRAMLLERGRIERIGDPIEVGRRYMLLDPMTPRMVGAPKGVPARAPVRVRSLRLHDAEGGETNSFAPGKGLRVSAVLEAERDVDDPRVLLRITTGDGVSVFAPAPMRVGAVRLRPGGPVAVDVDVENELPPGRYALTCAVATGPGGDRAAISGAEGAEFDVLSDGGHVDGLVSLAHEVHFQPVSLHNASDEGER
jgi:ABC-2 type transport system ATP-binding protein